MEYPDAKSDINAWEPIGIIDSYFLMPICHKETTLDTEKSVKHS